MSEPPRIRELCLDQCQRWRDGERVLVEAYLGSHPSLHSDPEGVLDLIYNEIVLRGESLEEPAVEEYLRRFPEYEAQLRLQFEVHRLIQKGSVSISQASFEDLRSVNTGPAVLARTPRVPGYEILGELGRGGMGVVYKARQLSLQRVVALKMILAGAHVGSKERARFCMEAEAVARLRHSNIVQIYEIGEHDGLPYFAFEYVEGTSLSRMTRGRPQSALEVALLLETLARAMHHAHCQGIIHRDLKPANVLLYCPRSENGSPDTPLSERRLGEAVPKITDFGLAKLLNDEGTRTGGGLTHTGAFLGTPQYCAPEQASGRSQDIGPSTDVYGLGAILYELLTGQPPFQGRTLMEMLMQVRTMDPVAPRRLVRHIPADLQTICLKCLEKEQDRRYLTAIHLAEDLRRFQAGEPIRARPASQWERLIKWSRRRPAVAGLVAGTLALLVVLAVAVPWVVGLQARKAQTDALARMGEFSRLGNEAIFYGHGMAAFSTGTLFSAETLDANLARAEKAAREALALIHFAPETSQSREPDRWLSSEDNTKIAATCFSLIIVLADAVAERSSAERPDRHAEALQILDRALEFGPPIRSYHLRRARYLAKLGETGAARDERNRALAIPAATAFDFFLLGYEAQKQNEPREARKAFENALSAEPGYFWAEYFLACYHLQEKNWDAARARLDDCIRQQPQLAWCYPLRGYGCFRALLFRQAENDFETGMNLAVDPDARYSLLVVRGVTRVEVDRISEAIADFRLAIEMEPDYYHAYLNLAEAYFRQTQWDLSTEQLDRVLGLNLPESSRSRIRADCHAQRARNFYAAKEYDEALTDCARALELDARHTLALKIRGLAELEFKRYQAASDAFDEYLRSGGEDKADLYRARGHARVQLRRYLEACEDYTQAMKLEPAPDWEILMHRGWAYFFADSWTQAQRDFDAAIRLHVANADPFIGRGLAKVNLGDYQAGVADAEEALRRKPASSEMMHNLACIFALAASKAGTTILQPESAAAYRKRALEAIRKTLGMLPPSQRQSFWQERISREKYFDSLRGENDFRALEEMYRKIER